MPWKILMPLNEDEMKLLRQGVAWFIDQTGYADRPKTADLLSLHEKLDKVIEERDVITKAFQKARESES